MDSDHDPQAGATRRKHTSSMIRFVTPKVVWKMWGIAVCAAGLFGRTVIWRDQQAAAGC